MRRRTAIVSLCAALAGCQEYHFNPVGRCTIQPGQRRVAFEGFTTADFLFVVDDSGSMDPIQNLLATNFDAFIQALATTQQDRAGRGLPALDYHIAVTTSSIFENRATSSVCGGSPLTCSIPAASLRFPTDPNNYACSPSGTVCGDLVDKFYNIGAQCTQGLAPGNGQPFPAGSFVAASGNPKVIHLTKGLNWAGGVTDPTIAPLVAQFGQNIRVGSCGSGQEQHLQAGKLAIEKALAGAQTAPASEWPHSNSKLVVVWVGNEDDCSNPKDPTRALVMDPATGGFNLGDDSCMHASNASKLIPVADYAAFFASLGRPFAGAFIRPGDVGCDCVGGSCDGYGNGTRFKAAASAFRGLGAQVLEGSVCSSSFSTTLRDIANLGKPLEALTLPSQPASGVVMRLRIVDAANKTVKLCDGPSTASEWWFVNPIAGGQCPDASQTPTPTGSSGAAPSQCLAIKGGGGCEATAGQAYVAEYLGRVPANGCTTSQDCVTALGEGFTCDTSAGTPGTCLCSATP